ncbi:MAG: type II toxin-antitoxin system YafQ family toxin [Sphingomonas sp.]|nr:type II toxin-antitoxin system YafQ family toxin [Sphingomonas sp.]
MRVIDLQSRFKRDYKREKKANPKLDDVLTPVLNMLATDSVLPPRLHDHALSGDWKGFRDCHVKPDLVLIYAKSDGILSLARLGSHSELFG